MCVSCIFSNFTGNTIYRMTSEEYKKLFSEDDAVGWLYIDKELEKLYPGQEPKHFAPALHYAIGGEDPLDGISVYESEKQASHFHFVTYGFSELYYNEESAGNEFSKFGFELSFRLKREGGMIMSTGFAISCKIWQSMFSAPENGSKNSILYRPTDLYV